VSTEEEFTRSPAQVEATRQNPLAAPEELAWLNEVDLIQHPNCPVEDWWRLAGTLPLEAQKSPLYSLLTLESPVRWLTMERGRIDVWIQAALRRLPRGRKELFAADCAERVLYLYENLYISEAPRLAMEARRAWGRGKTTAEAWEQARLNAEMAADSHALAASGSENDAAAAFSAAWATARQDEEAAVRAACRAIHNHAEASNRQQAVYEEQKWQWARVQQYANGEI